MIIKYCSFTHSQWESLGRRLSARNEKETRNTKRISWTTSIVLNNPVQLIHMEIWWFTAQTMEKSSWSMTKSRNSREHHWKIESSLWDSHRMGGWWWQGVVMTVFMSLTWIEISCSRWGYVVGCSATKVTYANWILVRMGGMFEVAVSMANSVIGIFNPKSKSFWIVLSNPLRIKRS